MKLKLLILTIVLLESTLSYTQNIYCTDTSFLCKGYLPNESWYVFPNVLLKNNDKKKTPPNDIYRLSIYPDKNGKIADIHLLKDYINTTELIINGDLDRIPDEVFTYSKLKKISLINIKSIDWEHFFKRLSKIKQLESLDILACSFDNNCFPESICLLKQLYRLEFDMTFINTLPDSFNLTNLCFLRLKRTGINTLPSSFKSDNLKYLDISYNEFNGIPKQIDNFNNISTLEFSGNVFYSSDTLKLLNNREITNLYLDACGIEVFPTGLRNLPKLRSLWLVCNKISSLPDEILDFKNLQHLPITFRPDYTIQRSLINKMTKIPFQIMNCPENE